MYSDEELLAAKRNRLAVNRTFSGRHFAGCLPFFRLGQDGVLEKQEASAEEVGSSLIVNKRKFFDVQQTQTLPMEHCGLHALEVTNLNLASNNLLRICFKG